MLRQRLPRAELTIIGPARPLADVPGVRWRGHISKHDPQGLAALREEYDRADVFVLPTLYEPFGIAYCEAMARGLPCVGTRVCAVPEIIAEGVSGELVPPGQAEPLAAALHALLSQPRQARALGAAGFARYRQNFRWQAVAQRMLAACDELAASRQTAAAASPAAPAAR